jgi:hypothetical protein
MAFNVDEFRTNLAFDGARPNLFEVNLTFPGFVALGALAGSQARFKVKTAQLPGSTIGTVEVPYFGRQIKVAGNRTFAEWSVTILNDEDFVLRNAFEAWHRGINENTQNLRNSAAVNTNFGGYGADAQVWQYGKSGSLLKEYLFVGLWPSDIAAIDLDWGSNDTIEEYSVTFTYQYWESVDTAAAAP